MCVVKANSLGDFPMSKPSSHLKIRKAFAACGAERDQVSSSIMLVLQLRTARKLELLQSYGTLHLVSSRWLQRRRRTILEGITCQEASHLVTW